MLQKNLHLLQRLSGETGSLKAKCSLRHQEAVDKLVGGQERKDSFPGEVGASKRAKLNIGHSSLIREPQEFIHGIGVL